MATQGVNLVAQLQYFAEKTGITTILLPERPPAKREVRSDPNFVNDITWWGGMLQAECTEKKERAVTEVISAIQVKVTMHYDVSFSQKSDMEFKLDNLEEFKNEKVETVFKKFAENIVQKINSKLKDPTSVLLAESIYYVGVEMKVERKDQQKFSFAKLCPSLSIHYQESKNS